MRPNTLGLPGPSLWDMARGFRAVRSDSIKFLEQTHSTYGDLVALPVPGPPVLSLGDPEAVRHVLHAHAANWTKATPRHASLTTVTEPAPTGWKRPERNAFVTLRPRGGLRLVVIPLR